MERSGSSRSQSMSGRNIHEKQTEDANTAEPGTKEAEVSTRQSPRQNNLQAVTQFFSSERAEKALKSAHMDPMKVRAGGSLLP